MKRPLSTVILALAMALALSPLETLVMPRFAGRHSAIAQAQQQQDLTLTLVAHKRSVRQNRQGQPEVVWQSLEGSFLRPAPRISPGDVIRYTISGNNQTEQPISGLVLTDDIPENATYITNSAGVEGSSQAQITFSIDGGQTYSDNPTLRVVQPDGTEDVRPAPPELYTHIRWTFQTPVAAKSTTGGSYQVRVQ